ncbi:hypothetical protein HYU94_00700 [Candidatus Daviesbacteria bacterium]|nr:hypothetical protein [Candidatus Daviesbacteria bacterium]
MANESEPKDFFDPYAYLRGELVKRGITGPGADSYLGKFQQTVKEDLDTMAKSVESLARGGRIVDVRALLTSSNFTFPGNAKQRADEIIQGIERDGPRRR